jgi:flagellar basal body-associated protein FliL
MAEEERTEEQAPKEEGEAKPKSLIAKLLPWVILLIITAASAAGGFGLSSMLAAPGGEKAAEGQKEEAVQTKKDDGKSAKLWYHPLEPVTANLDEPGAARYVRAVLVLEMSPELKEDEGKKFLEQMNPTIVDWLHVYLMSLTLDDVTGKNNINRVQAQILDSLNELLWPNSKPMIKRVLIKEFPIQ